MDELPELELVHVHARFCTRSQHARIFAQVGRFS